MIAFSKASRRQDIARFDPPLQQVQAPPLQHRNESRILSSPTAAWAELLGRLKPKRLDGARHRVRGIHPPTRTRAGDRVLLDQSGAPRRRELPTSGMLADRFEHTRNNIQTLSPRHFERRTTRQNSAPIDKNRRPVHPGHRHDTGRHVLVTTTERHEAIHPLAAHHRLDRVGDHLAAHQASTSSPQSPSKSRLKS